MRLAVDVMGGDYGCGVAVRGALQALKTSRSISELYLVGDQGDIEGALEPSSAGDARLKVVHASQTVTMEDDPLVALRKRKKDNSMLRAVDLVRENRAEAVVSLGNTGALVATSTIRLRRLKGVDRPAIATIIPSATQDFVLIDSGANPECKPLHLLQFAIMGNVYSRQVLHHPRPRVGILSNGTEPNKGNELTREAVKLCQRTDLNFLGYVEGHDLFADRVDVVVTDGFTGNIVLKTCESMGRAIMALLKKELAAALFRRFGALLANGAFRKIKHRMDADVRGGAPLFGLNGTVIKAHGSSRERAIASAIGVAVEACRSDVNRLIQEEIAEALESLGRSLPAVAAEAMVGAQSCKSL